VIKAPFTGDNIRPAVHALQQLPVDSTQYTMIVQEKKADRSTQQNNLQFKWLQDLERQGDMSLEEYRRYCKLHFGVPILRKYDPEFREWYNEVLLHRTYEQKIKAMDYMPVTRLMKVKQMQEYLDEMEKHWRKEGFFLTVPDETHYR
jgi:hypothetical protein